MRWRGREGSSNVDDRRRMSGGKKATGIGGIIMTAVIAYIMSGGDMGAVLNSVISETISSSAQTREYKPTKKDEEHAAFVSVILKDTEDVWQEIFTQNSLRYKKPTLVMFRGTTTSGCGEAHSQMGPFYCPSDQKVYIDLGFFDELQYKFKAKGDFAQAYVIAHEIGHHVQNLFGILPKVHKKQKYMNKIDSNKLSVKTELQADCFAGVWAKKIDHKKQLLDRGDIEEALNAASRIGDDTLQRQAGGEVVPDSFTHGSASQRKEWFYRGYNSGNINSCNTFSSL
ncbi:MAG TPA: metalloprotease [Campylobacterales bacterium]|nr:metalloprotease [Campylobacterales bacterium]